MENKYQGGVKKDKWHKKLFAKKHKYSGLVSWPTSPIRQKPSQRFQTSPHGDSTSCVAQSQASHIEVKTGIVVSAKPTFFHRNPQTPGMSLSEADQNILTYGTNTEILIPSQRMTDAELDLSYNIPTPIKSTGRGVFVPLNADSIADVINQFGGVKVTFESNENEWDAPNQTPVYNGTDTTFGHCIFLFDNWTNNGVKTFEACDSDGLWSSPTGIRHITEAFLLKRATGASYSPNYALPDPTGTYPQMTPEPKTFWDWFWYYLRGGK